MPQKKLQRAGRCWILLRTSFRYRSGAKQYRPGRSAQQNWRKKRAKQYHSGRSTDFARYPCETTYDLNDKACQKKNKNN